MGDTSFRQWGEFTATIISDICKEVGTFQVHGAPYHPQSQGVVERFNQTLKIQVAKYMDECKTNRWLDYLPSATRLYNKNFHEGIKGFPYEVWSGQKIQTYDLPETSSKYKYKNNKKRI